MRRLKAHVAVSYRQTKLLLPAVARTAPLAEKATCQTSLPPCPTRQAQRIARFDRPDAGRPVQPRGDQNLAASGEKLPHVTSLVCPVR